MDNNSNNNKQNTEKINPDIFKKIFKRNYSNIVHTSENNNSSTTTTNTTINNSQNSIVNDDNYKFKITSRKSSSQEFLNLKDIIEKELTHKVKSQSSQQLTDTSTITLTTTTPTITMPPNCPLYDINKNKHKKLDSLDSLGGSALSTADDSSNTSLASFSNSSSEENDAFNNTPNTTQTTNTTSLLNTKLQNLKFIDNQFKTELDLMLSSPSSEMSKFYTSKVQDSKNNRKNTNTNNNNSSTHNAIDSYEVLKSSTSSISSKIETDPRFFDSNKQIAINKNIINDFLISKYSNDDEGENKIIDNAHKLISSYNNYDGKNSLINSNSNHNNNNNNDEVDYESLLRILIQIINDSCKNNESIVNTETYKQECLQQLINLILSNDKLMNSVKKSVAIQTTKSEDDAYTSEEMLEINDDDDDDEDDYKEDYQYDQYDDDEDEEDVRMQENVYDRVEDIEVEEEEEGVDENDDDDDEPCMLQNNEIEQEFYDINSNTKASYLKYLPWTGQHFNSYTGSKLSVRNLFDQMEKISENLHEDSTSSLQQFSTSKNESKVEEKMQQQEQQQQQQQKVYDETLRDAENISDIEESEVDAWPEVPDVNNYKIGIINFANESQSDQINFQSERSSNNRSQTQNSLSTPRNLIYKSDGNENKPLIKSVERNVSKNINFRCDAMVMFDAASNVNFCKLCKLYAVDPPSINRNGVDIGIQVDEVINESNNTSLGDEQFNSEDSLDEQKIEFRKSEQETELAEVKIDFEYTIENRVSLKYDEEVLKQRHREGLKFWEDMDKNLRKESLNERTKPNLTEQQKQSFENKLNEQKSFIEKAPQNNIETDNNLNNKQPESSSIKNKISVFESRASTQAPKRSSVSPVLTSTIQVKPATKTTEGSSVVKPIIKKIKVDETSKPDVESEKENVSFLSKQGINIKTKAMEERNVIFRLDNNERPPTLNTQRSVTNEVTKKINDDTNSNVKNVTSFMGPEKNVNHVNILMMDTEIPPVSVKENTKVEVLDESDTESDSDKDMEEVEVVINLNNLPKILANFNQMNDDISDSSSPEFSSEDDVIRKIIMDVTQTNRKSHVDDITEGVKVILGADLYKIRKAEDLPSEVLLYITKRHNSLCREDQATTTNDYSSDSEWAKNESGTSFSERNKNTNEETNEYETTEVTVVKDYRQLDNDDTNRDGTDVPDVLKVEEETLYIVEKKRKSDHSSSSEPTTGKLHEVDREVRKSFELKSKDENADNEIQKKHSSIGYSPNDKFSAERLYDLNKHVVHKNELQQLSDQYKSFRNLLTSAIDELNKLDKVNFLKDKSQSEVNDYQLHFMNLYDDVGDESSLNVLLLSYDKANNSENFNGEIELLHTQYNVDFLNKTNERNVIARLNVVCIDDSNEKDPLTNFETFSIIKCDESIDLISLSQPYFIHVKYFNMKSDKQDSSNPDEKLKIIGTKETLLDVRYLPDPVRAELVFQSKEYLNTIPPKKKASRNDSLKYQNDNLELPQLNALVLESSIIQKAINKKRDQLVQNALAEYSDKTNSRGSAKIVELEKFMESLEQEINSYLICERVKNRSKEEIDVDDLVKLNKLDALISYETVQNYKDGFRKLYPLNQMEIVRKSSNKTDKSKQIKKFYLIDSGKYYRCVIPNEYLNNKLNQNDSSSLIIQTMHKRQHYIFSQHLKSVYPSNTQDDTKFEQIRSIRLKQSDSKRRRSKNNINIIKKISSLYKQSEDRSPTPSDSDNKCCITVVSAEKPGKKYRISIDYDKKEVRKSEMSTDSFTESVNVQSQSPVPKTHSDTTSSIIPVYVEKPNPKLIRTQTITSDHTSYKSKTLSPIQTKPIQTIPIQQVNEVAARVTPQSSISSGSTQASFQPSPVQPQKLTNRKQSAEVQTIIKHLVESGVQVNDEEKELERRRIVELLNENNFLKQQVNNKTTMSDNNYKDQKYTYDMIDRSSHINEKKSKRSYSTMEPFDVEECNVLEYDTMRNDLYLKFDEQEIKSMERKLIRDDIIIKSIDKMFHSIRDHQGSNARALADAPTNFNKGQRKRRSNSWSYSSGKRHVRAKVMEVRFADKQTQYPGHIQEPNEHIFLRIDDYLNPQISKTLTRSYSMDYLNEKIGVRTRIRYLRIPGDIIKTESITQYQHNVVPPEFRTVPYGLRYWSILKLLQEERESGRPYIYLGDTYLGQPPVEWLNSSEAAKEVLINRVNKVEPNKLINSHSDVLIQKFHLDSQELTKFMSTNNLDDEITMIRRNEEKFRKNNTNNPLINNLDQQFLTSSTIYSPKHSTVEKTINYERLPDRIISVVEKIEASQNVKYAVPNQNEHVYNKYLNQQNVANNENSKKYPLIDDVLNFTKTNGSIHDVPLLFGTQHVREVGMPKSCLKTTNKPSASIYGLYYEDTPELRGDPNVDFIDLSNYTNATSVKAKQLRKTSSIDDILSNTNLVNVNGIYKLPEENFTQAELNDAKLSSNIRKNSKSQKDISTSPQGLEYSYYHDYLTKSPTSSTSDIMAHFDHQIPVHIIKANDVQTVPKIHQQTITTNNNIQISHKCTSPQYYTDLLLKINQSHNTTLSTITQKR